MDVSKEMKIMIIVSVDSEYIVHMYICFYVKCVQDLYLYGCIPYYQNTSIHESTYKSASGRLTQFWKNLLHDPRYNVASGR